MGLVLACTSGCVLRSPVGNSLVDDPTRFPNFSWGEALGSTILKRGTIAAHYFLGHFVGHGISLSLVLQQTAITVLTQLRATTVLMQLRATNKQIQQKGK